MNFTKTFLIFLLSISAFSCQQGTDKKIVIAHRGACAYLPEHTLESKAMAYAMGVDYIEQDVALSKDNRAIVIHDHYLDTVSNVKEVYPGRNRKDGRYYVIDFTLKELLTLTLHERIDRDTGKAAFPQRYPLSHRVPFRIHTLDEEIEMIQGMNKSTGNNIGIYTELKAPWFHKKEGKDIARTVLDIVNRYGYNKRSDRCYLQCFDPACLKYLRTGLKTDLKLIQLIADNSWNETPGINYDAMRTLKGIKKISAYADGVGPWTDNIVTFNKDTGKAVITDFVKHAHSVNLQVHPFTFRADKLPEYVKTYDELLNIFIKELNIDGFFTDFPDRGVAFLKRAGYHN